VALAMGGRPFYLICPRVVQVRLAGRLQPWVSAKDVILKVLEIFTTKGNVNTAFEYGGGGVESLSVPERATIANMGAECGVTTSVFPSDEVTRAFLKSQGREGDWRRLEPDGMRTMSASSTSTFLASSRLPPCPTARTTSPPSATLRVFRWTRSASGAVRTPLTATSRSWRRCSEGRRFTLMSVLCCRPGRGRSC